MSARGDAVNNVLRAMGTWSPAERLAFLVEALALCGPDELRLVQWDAVEPIPENHARVQEALALLAEACENLHVERCAGQSCEVRRRIRQRHSWEA